MSGVYANDVQIYFFGEFHICISGLKKKINSKISHRDGYEIEVFIWKFEYEAVYICLVGGVVIFDESWAGKGLDSQLCMVHLLFSVRQK